MAGDLSGSFTKCKTVETCFAQKLSGNMNLSDKRKKNGVTDLCVFGCYFELK